MRRPWFSYYVDDFELNAKVRVMTAEQEGCYHRLLRYQWREGCVPDEMRALAQIARQSPRKMQHIWKTLEPLFPHTNGSRKNPRMTKEWEKAEAISEKRSKSAYKQHASTGASATEVQPVCKPPCDIHKSHTTVHKQKALRETWLTAFGKVWEGEYGGEPPWGRLGKTLKPLVAKHGDAVFPAWVRYCNSTVGQFASVERFAQTYGSWKPKQGLKELTYPDD